MTRVPLPRFLVLSSLLLFSVGLAADTGCSDDGTSSPVDATGADDGGPGSDTALSDGARTDLGAGDGPAADGNGGSDLATDLGADQGIPTIAEQEPNDGAGDTDYNDVAVPQVVTGAIGTADDDDIFAITAEAGDRWTATAVGSGGLQPHLTVFDSEAEAPTAINPGTGSVVMLEYYALKAGRFFLVVRDRRNVGSSAGVGDPSLQYTLTITALSRAPIPVTVGGEAATSLDPVGRVAVFSFDANEDDSLLLSAWARRVVPASDVDTRLSLFFPAQGWWGGNTNDDGDVGETDSWLSGNMPFTGTYHVVVEDEAAEPGADRRVTLKVSATQ